MKDAGAEIKFTYKVGDPVKVKEIKVNGRIDAYMHECAGDSYRVIYWNDGARHATWMNEWELEPRES